MTLRAIPLQDSLYNRDSCRKCCRNRCIRTCCDRSTTPPSTASFMRFKAGPRALLGTVDAQSPDPGLLARSTCSEHGRHSPTSCRGHGRRGRSLYNSLYKKLLYNCCIRRYTSYTAHTHCPGRPVAYTAYTGAVYYTVYSLYNIQLYAPSLWTIERSLETVIGYCVMR